MNLMPDVSNLTEDESLGAQRFTIIRSGGHWVKGKFVEEPKLITAYGIIQPSTPNQINQIDAGDRTEGMISIWSKTPFVMANQKDPHVVSDVVEWLGNRYKVSAVMPWTQYGFSEATLTRM